MANLHLKSPSSFPFSRPDEWPSWKRRFEQFRLASGLSTEDDLRQISTLLYCMGEEAEDILNSTNISNSDRKKYDRVVAKFDSFFKVRKNVIFERARFNRRSQLEGESVEQFITTLYKLADSCDFRDAAMRDEMIRDRIVVGIRDSALSERLQMDADLTLDKAKKLVRQREAVQEHQVILKSGEHQTAEMPIDYVGSRKGHKQPSRHKSAKSTKHNDKCPRCGREPHSRISCPAKEAVCHNCKKRGHYSSQCFKKTVSDVTITTASEDSRDSEYVDTSFLDTVDAESHSSWKVTVLVNNQPVLFKIDTGAEVSVISENIFSNSLNGVNLQQTTKRLGQTRNL